MRVYDYEFEKINANNMRRIMTTATSHTRIVAKLRKMHKVRVNISDLKSLPKGITVRLHKNREDFDPKYFVNWKHLSELVTSAQMYFTENTSIQLPYNLSSQKYTGYDTSEYSNMPSYEKAKFAIQTSARFAGWLKASVSFYALRKVIAKTQSSSGQNSPYTKVNLWQVAKKWPSPGALNSALCKVKEKTKTILLAYQNQPKPSWAGLLVGLLKEKRIGKAAIIAAAYTLFGDFYITSYKMARAKLIEFHKMETDYTDGIQCKYNATPLYNKHGIKLYSAFIWHKFRWDSYLFCKSSSGRTYHYKCNYIDNINHFDFIVKEILAQWKKQDKVYRLNTDLNVLIGNDSYVPIISVKDSLESGNCAIGTNNWVSSKGWSNRNYIPAVWILPYVEEPRVKMVALYVANQCKAALCA